MKKSFSFAGKILRIDLSTGKIATEPTDKYAQKYLGGRGINERILYDEIKPEITSFDPASKLLFGTGVLCGTLAPTS